MLKLFLSLHNQNACFINGCNAKKIWQLLEHLQLNHQIFVLFGEWIVTFTFIYPLFQIHFLTNSLSHSLSHLNIIFSFIIYSFFNNYTYSNNFYSTPNYYNRKKGFEDWTVAHQTWWDTVHEPKKFEDIEKRLEHEQ